MLSDVYNSISLIVENYSFLIISFGMVIFIFSVLLFFSSSSLSYSSSLPDDADAYVLDSSGVLVPVYSFDRGD